MFSTAGYFYKPDIFSWVRRTRQNTKTSNDYLCNNLYYIDISILYDIILYNITGIYRALGLANGNNHFLLNASVLGTAWNVTANQSSIDWLKTDWLLHYVTQGVNADWLSSHDCHGIVVVQIFQLEWRVASCRATKSYWMHSPVRHSCRTTCQILPQKCIISIISKGFINLNKHKCVVKV